jgi:hypothetical protein
MTGMNPSDIPQMFYLPGFGEEIPKKVTERSENLLLNT